MNFHLEVYSGDDYLGAVRLSNRYAQALIGGEVYPFSRVEDACVALLALTNRGALNEAAKKKEET
jgi:hypothetical protein